MAARFDATFAATLTPSCNTPRGHRTEQYMRPNNSVKTASATSGTTLTAMTAGTTCHRASGEAMLRSGLIDVSPPQSTNNTASRAKTAAAADMRNILNRFVFILTTVCG